MSPRSFRRHCRFRQLTGKPLFALVDLFAVQTPAYAACVSGPWGNRVKSDLAVTGSIKYDGVTMGSARTATRPKEMAASLFGIEKGRPGFRGRQHPGSGRRDRYRGLGGVPQGLSAIAANPWFPGKREPVRRRLPATLLAKQNTTFVRRSELKEPVPDRDSIILVDSIGELNAVWGLSDIAFVGGSLDARRGGQNMIEPAAYGSAVVFGPHVWNFRETATRLAEAGAGLQIADAAALEEAVRRLLADPAERAQLGTRAQELVKSQQGATERTIVCLESLISATKAHELAA